MNDTICAIATSQGVGAIAIIRVSGEESISIVNQVFKGKGQAASSAYIGGDWWKHWNQR